MIITGTLITFVIGGGVFIFWPDLKNRVTQPKQKKKRIERLTEQQNTISKLYDDAFPAEEEFLEAVRYYEEKRVDSLNEARSMVSHRGQLLKTFLQDPNKEGYQCPVCSGKTVLYYSEVRIDCTCKPFITRAKRLIRDTGNKIW